MQVQALRGSIRETYREILGIDPDFSAANDVELLLWKNCFYKRIEVNCTLYNSAYSVKFFGENV